MIPPEHWPPHWRPVTPVPASAGLPRESNPLREDELPAVVVVTEIPEETDRE